MDAVRLFQHDPNRQSFAAGQEVFAQGSRRDRMFVVVAGEVEIRVDGVAVEVAGPGGLVGEMALIDDGPRSSTVVARTDSELVPVDRERFLFLVQQTPFFALTVMRVLTERLRKMNEFLRRMIAAAEEPAES
ncbi:MAG: cyclic nucleotide-binding domain-containing protein [Thermoanaerobaculia bacterium]|nr:cyclic nucleotide-binding domain-containing protein [Thermoanaerobaculia bacterium]